MTSVVCSMRDITERKRTEQTLRQALEREIEISNMRMRFLSMASHDLRNPLAVIRSGVDMLADYYDRLSEEKKEKKFHQIRTSIAHMVELLDDVLTIGRVEAGKLTFTPELVDLEAFCRHLLNEIQTTIGSHHVFNFVLTGESESRISDPKLLRHILFNLLSNAVKYSSMDSEVTLELNYYAEETVFRIRDRGIGIPEADQPRLFEPFHRANNVGVRSGTGLGLAIVQQSVRLHGGTLRYETQEGEGTTFTVILPTQIEESE
jgi:signal transduction histidine kinase